MRPACYAAMLAAISIALNQPSYGGTPYRPYVIAGVTGPIYVSPAAAVAAVVDFVRADRVFGKGVCKCKAPGRRRFFKDLSPDEQTIDAQFRGKGLPLRFHEAPMRDIDGAEFVIQIYVNPVSHEREVSLFVRYTPTPTGADDSAMIRLSVSPQLSRAIQGR